jgi:hypothetical protein
MNDPAVIDEMLRKAQTIAVVGMSDKPWRASHNIGRYLVMQGYRVLPVNPRITEVHGLKCYPDLDSAQEAARADGSSIDLVDVFRNSANVPPIAEDVIRLGIPYLWLQEDVMEILHSSPNLKRVSFRPESSGVEEPAVVFPFSESEIHFSISTRQRCDTTLSVTNPAFTSSNRGVSNQN